ncbi:hypothetical protein FCH33_01975 [Serratia fonticola]|uniref:hypothetical protein n=1 Tax=Serratia fonticola TaxID=47917 RepID=UPI001575CAE1|nr:hypothetical protein [Serratia fonticola]NTY85544.1 hypothetical protein [Serratia fonticola]NTZ11613.1 hypothetical protein [Serratia fonticola]
MLKNIHFRNYEVIAFDFKEYKDTQEGYFNMEFGTLEISIKEDDDLIRFFRLTYHPVLSGYEGVEDEEVDGKSDGIEKELAFQVNATIVVLFEIDEEENFSEEDVKRCIDDNNWYFKNYIAITTRLVYESLLSNTSVDSIKLPWSRPH